MDGKKMENGSWQPSPSAGRGRCAFARACTPAVAAGVLIISGCDGPQSTLATAGTGAERIAVLFWWMLAGGLLIWSVVMGIGLYAVRTRERRFTSRVSHILIIGGGVIFPVVVLAVLLGYGLHLLAELRAPEAGSELHIAVSGEQWWWRVRYSGPDGEAVELANEIRLPVGVSVELRLTSPDVIHSFWIPALGGKMDMIPGRKTRLVLEPTRTGVFRGACAEYCGSSHALMAFPVVVMEAAAFDDWLEKQRRPAAPSGNRLAQRGENLFLMNGCGACHSVRGTDADGALGPDLTHLGSRLTIGAATLPNDIEALVRWITHPQAVKPEARMPGFGMLDEADLHAIATYLKGLQ
ncbi:MAG: cytochrome c oxidase subunit II [Thiogranum sp.]|nr:cytochrome c oxidase subunit II [Thiogranum sp.]